MRVGSLFAGIGGFDLGFERAGMHVAWQCEIDEKCREVLARHWPDVPCHADIRSLDPELLPSVDLRERTASGMKNPTPHHYRGDERMKKRVAVLLALMALVVAGCGSDESREDANDVGNGQIEKSSPRVIAFNNHFPNVQTKCDGFGHRLYTISHDDNKSPNLIVIPDRTCQGPGTSYDDILRTNEQPPVHPPSTDPADYPPIVVSP